MTRLLTQHTWHVTVRDLRLFGLAINLATGQRPQGLSPARVFGSVPGLTWEPLPSASWDTTRWTVRHPSAGAETLLALRLVAAGLDAVTIEKIV